MNVTNPDVYTMLFEMGKCDSYWCIEEGPDGLLYISSNAMTRKRITPGMYYAWKPDDLALGFKADGVPTDLIDRFLEQAGLS